MSNREDALRRLVNAIAAMDDVDSIGRSGGGPLPAASESDVDIFVFCDRIPPVGRRALALQTLDSEIERVQTGAFSSMHWGEGDHVFLCGMEVWLMSFEAEDQRKYVRSVLSGERLDREGGYFYPTGRLATLLTMEPLFDRRGWLADIRDMLASYPDSLAEALLSRHLPAIRDTEDLTRAVGRGDVPFYHFALDGAMDHFLQALFALNRRYFPSRKRSLEIVEGFSRKPVRMKERLLAVIELGGRSDTLSTSLEEWLALGDDLVALNGK